MINLFKQNTSEINSDKFVIKNRREKKSNNKNEG